MAGTVSTVETTWGAINRIEFDWTSDASGNADGATLRDAYVGRLIRVVQIPSGGGTQPTDLYDVVVEDADAVDLLLGNGADISHSAASQVTDVVSGGLGCVAGSALTLHVTNAGSAKSGKTIVYIGGS